MYKIDDLYRLLLEREAAFQDKTQELFRSVKFLTEAIIAHLEVSPVDISWLSLDRIGTEIIVMLSVPHTVQGQYIPPSCSPVQLITIIIPESVVDTAESHTIRQFLDETFDIRSGDGDNPSLRGVIMTEQTIRRTLH